MPVIQFRGAYIRHADLRPKEAVVLTRIHMTADFSSTLCAEMGWNHELKDEVSDAGLSGEITSGHFVLEPNSRELKTHEIQFGFEEVRDFKLVVTNDDEGNPNGAEVRFVVVSAAPEAIELVNAWLRSVGTGKDAGAVLRVRYAAQGKLEEVKDKEDEEPKQGVLPDISVTGGGRRKRGQE